MIKHLVVGLVAMTCSHCAPHHPHHAPARPAVVTIDEAQLGQLFDVQPPQRMDVRMVLDDTWVVRCQDMGGEPIESADQTQAVCEGVDY